LKVTLVDIWVLIHWRTHTAANFVTNLFHWAAYLIGIWEFTQGRSHTVVHGVANHSHQTAIWRSTGEEGMLNKLVQTDEQNVSAIKMYSSLNPLFSDSFWRAYYITCGHMGPVQTRQKVKTRGEGQKGLSR
jgi:hypothetical protein